MILRGIAMSIEFVSDRNFQPEIEDKNTISSGSEFDVSLESVNPDELIVTGKQIGRAHV